VYDGNNVGWWGVWDRKSDRREVLRKVSVSKRREHRVSGRANAGYIKRPDAYSGRRYMTLGGSAYPFGQRSKLAKDSLARESSAYDLNPFGQCSKLAKDGGTRHEDSEIAGQNPISKVLQRCSPQASPAPPN
jgi:hypothetical protein